MLPSVPLPTDNLYKFLCLLGLIILIASIAALTALYISSLETKARLVVEMIEMESKTAPLPPGHEEKLKFKKKIFEVTHENETNTTLLLAIPLTLGFMLIIFGGRKWYQVVQLRDDQIGALQVRKLIAEVQKLEADIATNKTG